MPLELGKELKVRGRKKTATKPPNHSSTAGKEARLLASGVGGDEMTRQTTVQRKVLKPIR